MIDDRVLEVIKRIAVVNEIGYNKKTGHRYSLESGSSSILDTLIS